MSDEAIFQSYYGMNDAMKYCRIILKVESCCR